MRWTSGGARILNRCSKRGVLRAREWDMHSGGSTHTDTVCIVIRQHHGEDAIEGRGEIVAPTSSTHLYRHSSGRGSVW